MDRHGPILTSDPRAFGRGPRFVLASAAKAKPVSIGDDLRLFAMTFAAGFLFVSIFLG
jgi:hypothetical protein